MKIVLEYHSTAPDRSIELIDGKSFKKHISFLKKLFHFCGTSEFFAESATMRLRKPKALLTLDDGFKTNASLGAKILDDLKIPAVLGQEFF